jgi:group I intron endonuclease
MAILGLRRPGVYVIRNTVNGKVYVGSAIRIDARWRLHLKNLREGNHHSWPLQVSWNKHGEAAFKFEVLEFLSDKKDTVSREQHWMDALGVGDPKKSYNLNPKAGSALGIKRRPESVEKLRAALTGKKRSAEFCEYRRQVMLGVKPSEHAKALRSLAMRGRAMHSKRRLNYTDAQEIRRRYAEGGVSQSDLGLVYGISRESIRDILNGRFYQNP